MLDPNLVVSETEFWEAAVSTAEQRFHKLCDEAEAMSIQGYLQDGTVVYWNRASEMIYGFSAQEAIGRNLLDLIIPPAAWAVVQHDMAQMFETGKGIPAARLTLRHKDGHPVSVFSSHTVVALPGHPKVMFCMDADMSALAQAEEELRIAATAFESQQGMLITDAQDRILRVNSAFTQATGYRAEELLGQSPRILRSGHQEAVFFDQMWHTLRAQGSWQGELSHRRQSGEVYTDWATINAVRNPLGEVTHYVYALTDITQRKQVEAQLTQLAFYDALTHLPNRRLLHDRLHQAIAARQRHRHCAALLFVDVDDFKGLNDTLGHEMGDLLLQQLADRLQRHVRDSDTVARFGGDKFVVMLDDLSDDLAVAAADAERTAHKLLSVVGEPYTLREQHYRSEVSIGITLFQASDCTVDELIRQAEMAMYAAKAAGRNKLRFFDVRMQSEVSHRVALINSLREGLKHAELRLFCQPQVSHTGQLIGAEALVRWAHPERGMVSPAEFIPIAESSGLILPLGIWVMAEACRQLVAWSEQLGTSDFTLAVNVSAAQFAQPDFVDQVRVVLNDTGTDPRRLKLELTESMLVNGVDDVIAKMESLRQLGVGFSLDDFGTGYSSLSYLQRLPLNQLKIDQSFVAGLQRDRSSEVIVQTIIALGQSLGLTVIAEGVETESQRDMLTRLGCEAFQGYLIGRPMPMVDFEARFLRRPDAVMS